MMMHWQHATYTTSVTQEPQPTPLKLHNTINRHHRNTITHLKAPGPDRALEQDLELVLVGSPPPVLVAICVLTSLPALLCHHMQCLDAPLPVLLQAIAAIQVDRVQAGGADVWGPTVQLLSDLIDG